VEALTDQMEREILRVMKLVEDAGGMYRAAESGRVQQMIGESALRFQRKVESGEQTLVGVNAYQIDETDKVRQALEKPDPVHMARHLASFKAWKAARSQDAVRQSLDDLARAAESRDANVFEAVVAAADAGCTHGEICGRLREVLGFGQPLAIV
jgi:methylmalonyl-CoA mutase N-terminal domain/subunit